MAVTKTLHADAGAQTRRWAYALLITLTAGVCLGRIFSPARVPSFGDNDRSRWVTIRALGDQGTYAIGWRDPDGADRGLITEENWRTIDKVLHPQTHKFYSSKPPLLPTVLAGEYWLIKRLTGWTIDERPWEIMRIILLTVNWLPLVIYLILMVGLVERIGTTDWGRLFVMAAACLGTFLTTFVTTLNNHTVAAFGVLFALYPFVTIWFEDKRDGWRFVLAGLFAAWTACNELPAASFGLGLFLLLAFRAPGQTLAFFTPAALVLIAAFLLTNYLAVGDIIPVQVRFGSEWYEFKGSFWLNPKEIDAAQDPKWLYAFHLLIGHHGIFSLTPVFILSLFGMLGPLLRGPRREDVLGLLSLVLGVVVFSFYVWRTNNYGGWTSGPRWFFWLTPLWLLAMLPTADDMARRRVWRGLAYVLLVMSALSAAYPPANPWRHPWLYDLLKYLGLVGY